MKTYLILALTLILVSGCGPEDKNPIEDYQSLDLATKNPPSVPPFQSTMTQLFQIDALDHLTFVQGEQKEVRFSVRTGFSTPEGVFYNVIPKQIPSEFGAIFKKSGEYWVLSWKPGNYILNSSEAFKTFPLELQFVLDKKSSDRVKAQFAGHHDTKSYEVILMKDSSQPIIEDEVTVLPSKEVKASETVQLQFVVAAKGLDSEQALAINVYEGPSEPSRELVQFDGSVAINKKAKRLATLGLDKSGRTRYKYQIEFKAPRYNSLLVELLNSDSLLKKRFESGQITSSEAAFSIEAFNPYNKMSSAQRLVILNVAVAAPAGAKP